MKNINDFKKYASRKILYYILPVTTVVAFIILYRLPFGFIPDGLSLSNNNNIASYLSTIISSISSLTGFLIAILIIALEYYQSNLSKIYLKYYIRNKSLIALINIYIFVFIFSGLTLLVLKTNSPYTDGELTVSYISLISFILLIPITFLLSYCLVKSLSINDIIDEYLYKLSFNEIFLINDKYKVFTNPKTPNKQIDQSSITKLVENDTLRILQKFIINLLDNDNPVTAQIIMNEVSAKFSNFILDKEENEVKGGTKFHQYRYGHFLLSIVEESELKPELGAQLVFKKILELVEEFYFRYNEKGYKLSYIEPFRESTYSRLIALSKGNEQKIERILKSVKKVIDNTIENNLPDEDYVMYSNPIYKDNQTNNREINIDKEKAFESKYTWAKLKDSYPEYFVAQINVAIDNKSERLFLRLIYLYQSCVFSLYWKHKGENRYLKSEWTIDNFRKIIALYQDAIERDTVLTTSAYKELSGIDITGFYEHNELCARNVLVDYLGFVIWLNKAGKLNYDIFCGVFLIGNLGSFYVGNNMTNLGSYFAEHYHDDKRYQDGFEDVINTIESIFVDYKKGRVSEGVNYKTMILILEKIKENYLFSRKKQSKSQKVLRKLNSMMKEIKKAT